MVEQSFPLNRRSDTPPNNTKSDVGKLPLNHLWADLKRGRHRVVKRPTMVGRRIGSKEGKESGRPGSHQRDPTSKHPGQC